MCKQNNPYEEKKWFGFVINPNRCYKGINLTLFYYALRSYKQKLVTSVVYSDQSVKINTSESQNNAELSKNG